MGNYQLLATKSERDFYLAGKGQIVEFSFRFNSFPVFPVFNADHRGRPTASKTLVSYVRGKYLRNGRVFSNETEARRYLMRYLKHSVK